jgi:hypothetical protein
MGDRKAADDLKLTADNEMYKLKIIL